MHRVPPRRLFSRIRRKANYVLQKMQGKQSIHFLHIGKTGGTAIKYALEQYPATRRYAILLHPHSVRLCDIPKGEKVIFFLRDPVSKFVSGFHSRQRRGEPKFSAPWTADERSAFEDFGTPNQLATAISSQDLERKERAHRAMKCIPHVRASYWDWFGSEEYFESRQADIFFIGFQESLAEDFETLRLRLDLPQNVKLPTDDVLAHRSPQDLDKTLTDEAIENLKKWYREDIKFIALCERIIEKRHAE